MLLSRSLLKTSKGRDYITSLSNPCPTVFLGKTIFLIPSLNFSCFNLGLVSLILLPCTSAQRLALSSQCPPAGLGWLMLPEPVSSPGCATPVPQPLLAGHVLQPLGGPPQNLLQFVNIFPVLAGADVQNWTQYSRCGLPSAKPSGMITFLNLVAVQLARTAQVDVSGCGCQAHCWPMPTSLPAWTPQSLSSELFPCQPVPTCTAAGALPSPVRDLVLLIEFHIAPASPFLQPALFPRDGSPVPPVWCHLQT